MAGDWYDQNDPRVQKWLKMWNSQSFNGFYPNMGDMNKQFLSNPQMFFTNTSSWTAPTTTPQQDTACKMVGGPEDGEWILIPAEAHRYFVPIGIAIVNGDAHVDQDAEKATYIRTGQYEFTYLNPDQKAIDFLLFDVLEKTKSKNAPECWDEDLTEK